jgi:thiosulfate/3-mercaptopyruvate sulfurtransferase
MTSPLYPQPIVSTLWLEKHLQDTHLRIIDIRGRVAPASDPGQHYFSHHDAYTQSHIPGAVFVDWITDITIDGPATMQIASPEKFAALMGKLGINERTFVIAYDDASGMFAARLWWALQYYGHDQVAVLDGGWQKWLAENRPTTSESPRIPVTTFTPNINASLRRTADDVQQALGTDTRLVDVRTASEFTGESSRAKRSGHIPGAINLPRSELVSADGALKPTGVLQDVFAAHEITSGDGGSETPVVLYCNGGVSASYGLLALRQAGFEGGAVYDGSWKDWGNDDSRPIE